MRVLGADLSLNHGAVVASLGGRLVFRYYANNVGVAKLAGGSRINPPKGDSLEWKLDWIASWFGKILDALRPDFVGVEDFAYHASNRAHDLGAVAGVARLELWRRPISWRKLDVAAAKMFAAHDGSADKYVMCAAVAERWDFDVERYVVGANRDSAEDLADAFALMKTTLAEARLRAGDIQLKDLEHEKERQVFLRTNKRNKANILDREWIRGPLVLLPR